LRAIVATALFILSSVALAGGESWPFHVASIREMSSGKVVVDLRPDATGTAFPLNCPTLTLHAGYSWFHWLLTNDDSISRRRHEEAVSMLRESKKTDARVRFGIMGEGVAPLEPSNRCEVSSRALTVLTESDGTRAIYSFYKWP